MSFSNSTQIAVDIAICIERVAKYIESKSQKIAKNARGVLMCQEDLNELEVIFKQLSELSEKVAKNEELLARETMENCRLNGKVEYMTQVLQLCYNDYKNHKREDAVTYLNIALSNT